MSAPVNNSTNPFNDNYNSPPGNNQAQLNRNNVVGNDNRPINNISSIRDLRNLEARLDQNDQSIQEIRNMLGDISNHLQALVLRPNQPLILELRHRLHILIIQIRSLTPMYHLFELLLMEQFRLILIWLPLLAL